MRMRCAAHLVLVLLLLWASVVGADGIPARADTTAAAGQPGVTPPIDWTALGRSDRLDILGSDQVFDTDIPVPQGVTPDRISGQIGAVVNVIGGRVDVLDGRGALLGSIPAPADQASAAFGVDVSRAQVIDGIARLTFVLRTRNPPANSCTTPPSVLLSQLAATYLGTAPFPVVVSDFLPGYADQFLIRTGPSPSPTVQQAALDLVAKLTRNYRPMPVRIDVDTSPRPAPPGSPMRRVIELSDGPRAGLEVLNPGAPDAVLRISGRGDDLDRQVQLFTDRRVKLAQTRTAAVQSTTVDAPKAATTKTFAQLGMTGQISVLGSATLYAGFDAGQFSVGPIQQADLHLMAHYTPVVGGEASLVVRSGSAVLASRRLDESGVIDVVGTIPMESIQSSVGIALELRYIPSQQCAPLNDRMMFFVDPGSTVTVTPGNRNRGGFQSLPMAFTPDFDVAIDSPGHLRFAAEAVNLIAQQTGVSLFPRLTTLPVAAASGRGVLAVAPGEDLAAAGMTPTVLATKGTTVDITDTPSTGVDLNGPVGVIQVFTQRGRKVLAINGSGDWSLVGRSFDYIRGLDSRWASLSGDVVATGPAGQAVPLTLREGGPLINEYPGDGWKWWAVLSAAVSGAALLSAVVYVVRRRRPRRG